jgi:hypothetical protein
MQSKKQKRYQRQNSKFTLNSINFRSIQKAVRLEKGEKRNSLWQNGAKVYSE